MSEPTSPVDALLSMIDSRLLDVNTAIPGVIQSYANGIASVLPTGKKRFADGEVLSFPIIPNVRVCWPSFSGGKAGIKAPVRAGDSCLLVFSQQAVDGSDDRRMFDLQDAYAVMCDLGKVGQGDSSNNEDMTIYFGDAFIRLTEAGALQINAPAGTTITSPSTLISGAVSQSGGSLSSNGVVLASHTHGGVATGSGNTGAPNA